MWSYGGKFYFIEDILKTKKLSAVTAVFLISLVNMSEGPTIRPAFLRRSYLLIDDDGNKRQGPGGGDLIVVVFNNRYCPTLQQGTRAPVHLYGTLSVDVVGREKD